jgi:hypothetical protein
MYWFWIKPKFTSIVSSFVQGIVPIWWTCTIVAVCKHHFNWWNKLGVNALFSCSWTKMNMQHKFMELRWNLLKIKTHLRLCTAIKKEMCHIYESRKRTRVDDNYSLLVNKSNWSFYAKNFFLYVGAKNSPLIFCAHAMAWGYILLQCRSIDSQSSWHAGQFDPITDKVCTVD